VRSVLFGEADLVITLFTESRGIASAIARSARRSSKRFASLEPMHLLHVVIDERPGRELGTLVEAVIARPRLRLSMNLARIEAAGRALRWIRDAAPPHTPEPALWQLAGDLLDALDDPADVVAPVARLAAAGLRMLGAIGWGLDLERCVSCGRPCEAGAAAAVDAARGGLVCRACGGARLVLRAERRAQLRAAIEGDDTLLDEESVAVALDLVDATLAAHGAH
jgi:DNA repair protein RecO (recombination protein O)